jgi:hypothetical protein
VSGGVTLDVYGSVVIEGGNGGSVVGGGSNGGEAGSAMFEVSEHSLVNVGGTTRHCHTRPAGYSQISS